MNIKSTANRGAIPAYMQTRKWIPILVGAIVFAVQLLGSSTCDAAYQQNFKTGDRVKISTFDSEGVVTGFQNGMPKVKFKINGLEMETPLPADQLTKIEAPSSSGVTNKMRIWTSGKHKVEAKFLSEKNGKVELEKSGGLIVTLPAVKLSQEDQDYIQQLPIANSEDNPFAGGVMKEASGSNADTSPSGSISSLMEPNTEPNATSNEIALSPADSWQVTADAAVKIEASNRVITPSGSLAGKPFFSRLTNFVVSTNKQFAATTSTNAFDDFSELITVDIQKSKANPNKKIPLKDCKMLAISPSGNTVATIKDGSGADPGRIDFWRTGEGELQQTASWKTAGFHDRTGFAPTHGVFLDETRLLTIGRRVALWDCETVASLYSFQVSNTPPAFSPNKKQIAVASQGSIYVVGVDDGKVLGTIHDAGAALGGLAFSQNGRFLAGYSKENGAIRIWDLNDGELIQQMAAPGGSARSIQWVGNRYLLVSNNALMDVELRATVWNYNMASGTVFSAGDGRFWLVTKAKLVPIKLPHKKLTKLTGNFDPEDLLVLKPGVSVALEINLPFRPNEQKQIRDQLAAQLEGIGITIESSADYHLKLTVKKGKRQTAEMSDFHDPFGRRGTEKISYTPNICQVALARGESVLWQKSATYSAGGIIHMNQGESAQAAATRLCQPKPAFFNSIKIPAFIAVLPGNKPLGVSTITEMGLQ